MTGPDFDLLALHHPYPRSEWVTAWETLSDETAWPMLVRIVSDGQFAPVGAAITLNNVLEPRP